MKIQCDVCTKKEASIFCIADEASLCDSCDKRVHYANKLASKHQRFSLIHPSPPLSPLCDICQEKRALLFCQEDRAILCRDCEVTLHSGNEHTQKHNRFLLTGIKLSAISDNNNNNQNQNQNQIQIPSSDCMNGCDQVPDYKTAKSKPSSEFSPIIKNNDINFDNDIDGSTSSISEYLIETLPGWHFEDFFHDSPFAFSKQSGNKNNMESGEDMLSFLDVDLDKELSNSSQFENLGIRVPQAPQSRTQVLMSQLPGNYGNENGLFINNYSEKDISVNYGMVNKVSRMWRKDDGFTVPQINIQSAVGSSKKRHRF